MPQGFEVDTLTPQNVSTVAADLGAEMIDFDDATHDAAKVSFQISTDGPSSGFSAATDEIDTAFFSQGNQKFKRLDGLEPDQEYYVKADAKNVVFADSDLFNSSDASSQGFMEDVSENDSIVDDIVTIQNSMSIISQSNTSMNIFSTKEYTWNAIFGNKNVALSEVKNKDMSAAKYAIGASYLFDGGSVSPVDVSDFQTDILNDSTARQEVLDSSNAMNFVAYSSLAMDYITGSVDAINYIENNWNKQNLSDGDSPPVAPVYLVELEGGGGGGGSGYQNFDGGDGGDSVFDSATAFGGEGGIQRLTVDNPDGDCGGYEVSSENSSLVEGSDCGGGSGAVGWYDSDGVGGDGGYVKALVSNKELNTVQATVGAAGDPSGQEESDDPPEPGSVAVWVPPWA